MFEILGTALSSIVGGGLTGILGVAVQRIADYKNKQLDIESQRSKHSFELQLKRIDMELMDKEFASKIELANIEAISKENTEDTKAFAISLGDNRQYSAGNNSKLMLTLDFIRGLVRPGLTIYLCILTTLIYIHAKNLIGISMEPSQAYEVLKLVIGTVLYLTTSCLLWWFGVRNKATPPRR